MLQNVGTLKVNEKNGEKTLGMLKLKRTDAAVFCPFNLVAGIIELELLVFCLFFTIVLHI